MEGDILNYGWVNGKLYVEVDSLLLIMYKYQDKSSDHLLEAIVSSLEAAKSGSINRIKRP